MVMKKERGEQIALILPTIPSKHCAVSWSACCASNNFLGPNYEIRVIRSFSTSSLLWFGSAMRPAKMQRIKFAIVERRHHVTFYVTFAFNKL